MKPDDHGDPEKTPAQLLGGGALSSLGHLFGPGDPARGSEEAVPVAVLQKQATGTLCVPPSRAAPLCSAPRRPTPLAW